MPLIQALSDSVKQEKIPSYFVPAHCNLLALPAHQLCDYMNQYSHIITIGDSLLTRLLDQAFFMAMLYNRPHFGDLVNPRDYLVCSHLPTDTRF
jgi:hypothetical protein